MSENNQPTNRTRILTEFDVIIDLDLAMMELVQEKYNNPNFINQDVMNLSLHDIKETLLNREHESPLSVCIDDLDTANSLYHELLETKYDEILNHHSPTGIFKLMEVYNKTDGMEVTILCSSQEEADLISKYSPELHTLVKKHDEINIDDYNVYFLKSLTRIFVFNGKMKNKHIFIMGYRYNLFEDPNNGAFFPNPTIVRPLIFEGDRVGIIDVYPSEDDIHLKKKYSKSKDTKEE